MMTRPHATAAVDDRPRWLAFVAALIALLFART